MSSNKQLKARKAIHAQEDKDAALEKARVIAEKLRNMDHLKSMLSQVMSRQGG